MAQLCMMLVIGSLGLSSQSSMPSSRVALVSGANKGIGNEIVRLLAKDPSPWIILLGSRNQDRGNKAIDDVLKEINVGSDDTRIICCPLDLTDHASIQAAKDLVEKHGNGKLDVLINNAAICFNDPTLYGKVPFTPFVQQANITVQTNFFGTLHLTQTMIPLLLQSESPRIINIASAAGRLAILKSKELIQTFTSAQLQLDELESLLVQFVKDVEAGIHASKGWPNTCYGMSKLGIIAMTKILARDYPDMMINSVDPGYCATDQNDHQGILPASRGAITPVVLAKLDADKFVTGKHFFQKQEIAW